MHQIKKPKKLSEHRRYQQIASAISYLNQHHAEQPALSQIARATGVSESHLQRTFSEWVGISPKQFLQYLTKEYAKSALRHASVMDASHAAGLSGASRLYDLMVTHESVTPGEYKSGGAGIVIYYAAFSSPYGYCFIAVTARGICKLSFFDRWSELPAVCAELERSWPNASLIASEERARSDFEQLFPSAASDEPAVRSVQVLLKGTPFRLQVWEALMRIAPGTLVSYQQLAGRIGRPTAARAVASAVASNEVACLVPCHRVIRESGVLNLYRWGVDRKAALIASEAAARG